MIIEWCLFNHCTPKNNSHILVEDHEGNIGIGGWCYEKFENQGGFPIGIPVKWTTIVVFYDSVIEENGVKLISCRAFTKNMEPIDVTNFYDFSNKI